MNSPNELSFLPEDYLERKARRRANILCGALSVVVMGTIGTAFWLSERSMRGLDTEVAEVKARYAQEAGQIEAVKRMHAKQRQIVQHAELAAALVEKVPRSNVLAEFTNSLPPGASLLEVTLESRVKAPQAAAAPTTAFDARVAQSTGAQAAAKKAPEAPRYDVFVKLAGVAETDVQVATFISKLNGSSLLRDVNLVETNTFGKEKETRRRFMLEMMINPAAEVHDPATAGDAPKTATAAVPVATEK
jgi:Tfp pilus assembly protein PilN